MWQGCGIHPFPKGAWLLSGSVRSGHERLSDKILGAVERASEEMKLYLIYLLTGCGQALKYNSILNSTQSKDLNFLTSHFPLLLKGMLNSLLSLLLNSEQPAKACLKTGQSETLPKNVSSFHGKPPKCGSARRIFMCNQMDLPL